MRTYITPGAPNGSITVSFTLRLNKNGHNYDIQYKQGK